MAASASATAGDAEAGRVREQAEAVLASWRGPGQPPVEVGEGVPEALARLSRAVHALLRPAVEAAAARGGGGAARLEAALEAARVACGAAEDWPALLEVLRPPGGLDPAGDPRLRDPDGAARLAAQRFVDALAEDAAGAALMTERRPLVLARDVALALRGVDAFLRLAEASGLDVGAEWPAAPRLELRFNAAARPLQSVDFGAAAAAPAAAAAAEPEAVPLGPWADELLFPYVPHDRLLPGALPLAAVAARLAALAARGAAGDGGPDLAALAARLGALPEGSVVGGARVVVTPPGGAPLLVGGLLGGARTLPPVAAHLLGRCAVPYDAALADPRRVRAGHSLVRAALEHAAASHPPPAGAVARVTPDGGVAWAPAEQLARLGDDVAIAVTAHAVVFDLAHARLRERLDATLPPALGGGGAAARDAVADFCGVPPCRLAAPPPGLASNAGAAAAALGGGA